MALALGASGCLADFAYDFGATDGAVPHDASPLDGAPAPDGAPPHDAGDGGSPIVVVEPNAPGLTLDTGTPIRWTNASVPGPDTVRYDLDFSNDSGASWKPLVTDWGFSDELAGGGTSVELTSTGRETHDLALTLPRVAEVIEARLDVTGLPSATTHTESLAGHCEDGFANPDLITDAQVYDHTFLMGQHCEPPYDTEMGLLASGDWATVRYPGVSLVAADVVVDVTVYRFQINGVDNWGIYASPDNTNWTACGAVIPGQDGYTQHSRTCTAFTGTDLYVRVKVESAGSNVANGFSRMEVTYPVSQTFPWTVDLDVVGVGGVEHSHAGVLNGTETTDDLAAPLNALLAASAAGPEEWVTLPLTLTFTDGRVRVDGIHLEFTGWYWDTSSAAADSGYRVRVTQSSGTFTGAFDVNDADLTIAH